MDKVVKGLGWLLNKLISLLVSILAGLIKGILYLVWNIINGLLDLLFSLLPPSPFKLISTAGLEDIFAQINYLLPLHECIVILEAWLSVVAVLYVYSVIARWLKLIE